MRRRSERLGSLPSSVLAVLAGAGLAAAPGCSSKKDPASPIDGAGGAITDAGMPDAVDPTADAAGGDADAPGGEPAFSRAALLRAFGTNALTAAQDFLPLVAELVRTTAAHDAAPDVATRDAAREAFRAAFDVWQISELMQFGPAAPKGGRPGGADFRDQIYLYPLVNRCAVEEEIVAAGWKSPTFASSLANRRGFFALEYLLFFEGADTACGAFSPIVATGSWAALPAPERETRKRAYAAAVARDLQTRAQGLVDAWAPSKGNFLETFATAGPGNRLFAAPQAALNAVSDAIFYFEREMKDSKVGRPLGLRDCMAPTCPEQIESPFAARSKASFRANLVGFRRLMEGGGSGYAGLGFDDLLVSVGAAPLAATLRELTIGTEAALAAIEEPDFVQALAQDPASLRALYDAIKALTDLLKTQFTTVLNLELPQGLEGDND
ncbi:MAG TPA: imelysin family protein [Polyangia bacterium]